MSEEEKAIKWFKEKTLDLRIDSESLNYLITLKYLIENQQEKIELLDDEIKRIESYLEKQPNVPIDILVNIKNIIHSEVEYGDSLYTKYKAKEGDDANE